MMEFQLHGLLVSFYTIMYRNQKLFLQHIIMSLNEMTSSFKRIKNFNVSVKEEKNDVLFLRKLVPGGSEHSFGIHVAKMAGMPSKVLNKAHQILKKLEKSHSNEELTGKVKSIKDDIQLQFFNLDNPCFGRVER